MAKRDRQRIEAIQLTADQIQILAKGGLQPINKDETTVYRGNEQSTIVSIGSPAYGRYPVNSVTLIGDLAEERRQQSRYPEALEFSRTVLTGIVTAEPVPVYDQSKPNQYKLLWNDRKNGATQDLLPILQPLNMPVAAGFVMEVPISATRLGGPHRVLVFYLNQAQIREEEEGPPRPRDKNKDAKKTAGTKNDEGAKKDEAAKKDEGAQKDGGQAERQTAAGGESQTK
jgi:hypothetical protein